MANPLITTAHGTNRAAFGAVDWANFVVLSTIWGASFLFMAIGLDAFHPGLVTLLRIGFGAAFMLAIPRARSSHIPREVWPRIAVLSLIWMAIPLTLFPIAQQWIDSGPAGMLNGSTPIFTAVVASVLLKQLPGNRQMVGLVLGFVGIIAIAMPSARGGSTAVVGVVLVLVATVGYAFATNMVAPLQQQYGSLPIMARVQWLAVLMVLPYGLYGATQSTYATSSLLAMLAVGILGTGLAFVMMGNLIGSVGPTRATFITYVIPVVALILGAVFRNETVYPVAVAGVLLVIGGAFLASRREI